VLRSKKRGRRNLQWPSLGRRRAAAAGRNTRDLEKRIYVAAAAAVRLNNAETPALALWRDKKHCSAKLERWPLKCKGRSSHKNLLVKGEKMTPSRGFRVIRPCLLAVLGLMAFAASAQGEATSNWRVNGTNVNSTLLPEIQVKEVENKTASILFTTKGGTKVEILCTAISFSNDKLKTTGSSTEGTKTLTGCLTKLNGTTSSNCKPKAGGGASGTIITKKILFLLLLTSAGVPGIRIVPEAGTQFVNMELGELCAIGENIPTEGVINFKDCKGLMTTEAVEHLFEEGPGSSLTALGQPASLDGSLVLVLSGAHAGLKWSGIAG